MKAELLIQLEKYFRIIGMAPEDFTIKELQTFVNSTPKVMNSIEEGKLLNIIPLRDIPFPKLRLFILQNLGSKISLKDKEGNITKDTEGLLIGISIDEDSTGDNYSYVIIPSDGIFTYIDISREDLQ